MTDGIEHALQEAKAAASDKRIGVGGAGTRLFEQLGTKPIDLEKILVLDTPDVTHLKFRVVK